jgi:glycosyltransferase involved in cell wall biosynthesis
MKILFLHDIYIKIGGAERYITIKRNELEQKGHKSFLFTLTEEKNLKLKNSKILKLNKRGLFGSYLRMISIYFKLKNYINQVKPNLIYIQNNYEFPYSFLKACKGYKTIQKVHDYGIICPTRWCVYKDNLKVCDGKMGIKCLKHKCILFPLFLSYFFKLNYIKRNNVIKKYITPSKTLKAYMLKNGFKNVIHLKHGVDIKEKKEKIKRKKNLFIYVGRLHKHKGVYLLINAIKEVVKIKPFVRFKIIGSGPEENRLKNLIKKYRIEKTIKFLGELKHKNLYRYYKEATATIVPSIWIENYPYVVLESIYFKTPVIGSDIGGIKEQIINRKNGILFKRNNKKDLVKKILMYV